MVHFVRSKVCYTYTRFSAYIPAFSFDFQFIKKKTQEIVYHASSWIILRLISFYLCTHNIISSWFLCVEPTAMSYIYFYLSQFLFSFHSWWYWMMIIVTLIIDPLTYVDTNNEQKKNIKTRNMKNSEHINKKFMIWWYKSQNHT